MSGSTPDKPSQAEGAVGDDDLSTEDVEPEADAESGTIGDSIG